MLADLRFRLLAADDALALYGNASAAVSVLLRERSGLQALVMERAKRGSDPWSGQWSFPGGRRHRNEPLFDTACRETEEEIGLSPRGCPLLGCLAARAPANRPETLVLPFVFEWTGIGEPRPGPEVASTAWVSLAAMSKARTTATLRVRGREIRMRAFVVGPVTIWGFTYRALEDLVGLVSQ